MSIVATMLSGNREGLVAEAVRGVIDHPFEAVMSNEIFAPR
jgi:hypothetical protein